MELVFAFVAGLIAVAALLYMRSRYLDFTAHGPDTYAGIGPTFDIREELNGPILCEGVIFGPTGRVASRFVAHFHATWEGNKGVMTETFRYDSGETQEREWRLALHEDGRIRAEADDLIGAGSGQQAGSGVRLNYRIQLPDSSGGHVLDVIDWMYLVDNGTILNRSQFRKYGIKVAELMATMRKMPAEAEQQEAA